MSNKTKIIVLVVAVVSIFILYSVCQFISAFIVLDTLNTLENNGVKLELSN